MDNPIELVSTSTAKLFESAFTHAAIGMALVAPDGRWLRVNRAVCRLTGYPAEELLQLRFQDITHPDDLDLDLANVTRLLGGEASTYQMEKRYLRKDGTIVWVLLSVSLVSDDAGRPQLFISQILDISAWKESEARLRAAVDEIEKLRSRLLRVCAWTKRIEVGSRWIPIEEFLSDSLKLHLTHGMSDEAERLLAKKKS